MISKRFCLLSEYTPRLIKDFEGAKVLSILIIFLLEFDNIFVRENKSWTVHHKLFFEFNNYANAD